MNNKSNRKKRIWLYVLMAVLVIISLSCAFAIRHISKSLDAQYAADRWRGENTLEFSQVSCFIPESAAANANTVSTFRTEVSKAIQEASLPTDHKLFIDCWSCSGSATVVSDKANGSTPITAVGGEFFDFHPMRLLSGSYISEDDMMKDKVILDEELAWFLFGGTDLTGMTLNVGGLTLQVGGVVARETDSASKMADTSDMRLYMAYDTYLSMVNSQASEVTEEIESGSSGSVDINSGTLTCYEIVLPDPVKNFAVNLVTEKFPVKGVAVKENTGRFSLVNIVSIIKDFSNRSTQSGIPYPYWENAARIAENRCAVLLIICILTALAPLCFAVIFLVKVIIYGKTLFEDEYWPAWKDKIEEDVRVKQRAKWEKEHLPPEKQSEEVKAMKTRKERRAEAKAAKELKAQQEKEAKEAAKNAKAAEKLAQKEANKAAKKGSKAEKKSAAVSSAGTQSVNVNNTAAAAVTTVATTTAAAKNTSAKPSARSGPAPAWAVDETVDKLVELNTLRTKGVISEEEFERKKRELLS